MITFETLPNFDNTNKKIIGFDFDWTLIKPLDSRIFPKNINDWEFLNPNIPEIITNFYNKGYSIYVITNQTKEWKITMIKKVLEKIKIPIKVIVGFGKNTDLKKPNKELFDFKFNKKSSFYVGDAAGRKNDWSNVDKEFAENIGIKFKTPEEVFPNKLTKKENNINYIKKEQEIIILVGIQASGKSTFAEKKFGNSNKYKILNGDILKSLPKMIKEAKKYLNDGFSVIFDSTNGKKENRKKIIDLAKEYNISVRCFLFHMDIKDAIEWNKFRNNEVPKIALYTFNKYFEPPTNDECSIIDIY